MAHVGGNSGNDQHDEVPVVKGIGTDTKLWVIVSPVPTTTTVPEKREFIVKEEKVRLGEAGMEKENVATTPSLHFFQRLTNSLLPLYIGHAHPHADCKMPRNASLVVVSVIYLSKYRPLHRFERGWIIE